jgi:DNA polymerase-3 subunit delta
MAPFAADRRVSEARKADPDALRRAIEALAELELATRGGSELTDDTAAVLALEAMTAA